MKNVLITGATGGIGSAILDIFYKNGFNIIASGTNEDKLKKLQDKYSERVSKIKCDLSDENQINHLVSQAQSSCGSIDILINNAGITKDNVFLRMQKDQWDDVINVNLNSNFLLTKLVIKGMIKKRWGRIVNITSVVAKMGNAGQANYVASKSAIEGFSRTLAQEVASRNITINCVAPGFVNTDILSTIEPEKLKDMTKNIPVGRIGTPEDISNAVFFLTSEESSYITGQVIHVNGGLTM
ncbi:MAG: 3-oxoacyl-[acyl-carrier-protein] reductase [Pelagibacterales bacterium]|nr:3-oxoacyl-[acyl-carrier-protein] reductase [Pelagibacterales bacterium]